ncbi:MAG: stage III sporulation protein AC [Clostridia bacterium]|nr:stage III sporulation protein AC [Clostridia bacterium]MBR2926956.1 stage III sporulation protein AC [Clostridia bacterium]
MDISLIIKIAGVGLLVAVATQVLSKTGRDEQATFVTVAGILVVLMLLVNQIKELFDLITSVFGM